MLLIIIRSEYHQSYALFLMWYLSLELLFNFIMLYTNEYPVFIWSFICLHAAYLDVILLIAFYHFKIL